jgi:exopolysaccharide biosynthesis polyprenyl glycosylphosphotransferase
VKKQADGRNGAIQHVGSGIVAAMAPELNRGWRSPFVETLTRPPSGPLEEVADTQLHRVQPGLPLAGFDDVRQPATGNAGSRGLRFRLVTADVVATAGTWLVMGTINMPAATAVHRWGAALAATAVTLGAMRLLGLYRSRQCIRRGPETARIVVAVVAGAVTLELLRGDGYRSYASAIIAAASCVLALVTLRWVFRQWLRAQRAQGRYLRSLVMVGTNEDALDVWTMLRSQPELGYEVRGIIGKPRRRPDLAHLPNGRAVYQLPDVARRTDATGVLLVANAVSAAEVRDVIEFCTAQGLHVHIWPGFGGLGTRRLRRYPMSGETFLYVEPGRHPTWQYAAKRAIDLFGAAVGLLITAPILLLAWVAIRLEDGGPALYRQVRIGLDERPFVVYKLRSMALDADIGVDLELDNERTGGPLFKATHDPRVTRVGAVVRALSIDELPQFFNVLNGRMSLVGPRPALPHEVAQFDSELLRRHGVKPGITGLWQLEARDNPSFHAYRRLDLLYVDNWSIGLDLFILLATVPMVIARSLSIHRRQPQEQEKPAVAP